MGIIWRGHHVAQRIPIAVKALTESSRRSATFFEGFRHEVQAAARLSHSNIIMVFDYGTLPPEAEALSEGALIAGSPYIAMEFASGGTLWDSADAMGWAEIREMLLCLLNALAHAHACGIIHRDIKPGNVLLCTQDDPRPGWKLSDFGIAHASDLHKPFRREAAMSDTREQPSGTPRYMAPEQFRGRWRDYGPWTDLYALGIMAWELICGGAPYGGGDFIELAFNHIQSPLPAFEPRMRVPAEVESWLNRMLAKRHTERFQRAADAAQALEGLGQPTAPRAFKPMASGSQNDETMFDAHSLDDETLMASGDLSLPEGEGAPSSVVSSWLLARPSFSRDWRAEEHAVPLNLRGAGQGLYGLRTIPMVDRERPRDRLWAILEESYRTGLAQVVVLRGMAGQGKSRLAGWLCERAHEMGLAHTLYASHNQNPSPWDGLPGMMVRHFRCAGLDRERAFTRLEHELARFGVVEEVECSAMLELMIAGGDEEDRNFRRVRFGSPTERHVAALRHLARLGRDRCVVAQLDDAQWGADTLRFARYALEHRFEQAAPIVMVISVEDEVLEGRPLERGLLKALLACDGVEEVEVGPLEPVDVRALIQRLLGVSAELSGVIEGRAEGNPLFAVQLVGDWIQRGVLEMGSTGFMLKEGEQAPLPDDLHALWQGRLEGTLERFGAQALGALERAAVLGGDVHRTELHAACGVSDDPVPEALFETLVRSRMIHATEAGWSFAHGMLRESLLRQAAEARRLEGHHLACAEALGLLHGASGVADARRAHHLLDGGALGEALVPLLSAARALTSTSDFEQALSLLDARDKALDALGIGEPSRLWVEGAALRAEILAVQWRLDEAWVYAERAMLAGGSDRGRGEALMVTAHIHRQRGQRDRAMAVAIEAQAIFDALSAPRGVAMALLSQAITTREEGGAEAADLYLQARAIFSEQRDVQREAQCLYGLGNVYRQRSAHDEARVHYRRAMSGFEATGDRGGMADCINGLAEIARYGGDLEEAEGGYREAWELLVGIGSKRADLVRLNLGLVLIYRENYEAARVEALRIIERTKEPVFEAIATVCLLPCLAHRGEIRAWDATHARAQALLDRAAVIDPDLGHLCGLTGDMLLRRGDKPRARAAFKMAMAQWEALGNDDQRRLVSARLEALK